MKLLERLLIRRLKHRDELAFEEIVRLYQHRVYGLILRMLGNPEEAEDLAQEVFISVLKHIDAFREDSKFSTWLYRIVINHCKNRLKYLSRRGRTTIEGLESLPEHAMADAGDLPFQAHIDPPDRILEGRQLEVLIAEAITQLDEDHRLLIVLRDVEELSYEDICEVTGLNKGTVKSRIHRARMAIKEYVERHTQ